MKSTWIAPAAAVLAIALSVHAATAADEIKLMQAEGVQWGAVPPFLPPNAKIAVLSGNPMADGVYTLRLQMPAGYEIPAHNHPTAELVTIISGTLGVGHGDVLDRAKSEQLKSGSFVDIPAQQNHFAWAGPGGAVIQVHGMGPFAIIYVDPAKDPRHATSAKK